MTSGEKPSSRTITEAELSTVVGEVVCGASVMFALLCNHLDRSGVMSANKFYQEMERGKAAGLFDGAGLVRESLGRQVIDAFIEHLGAFDKPTTPPPKPFRPTLSVITGGKNEG